jgi:hypothetical protein
MLRRLATRIGDEGWSVLQLGRAGLLRPVSPLQLATILRALHGYGELGTAVTLAAVRHGDAVGLIDEFLLPWPPLDHCIRPGCGGGLDAERCQPSPT